MAALEGSLKPVTSDTVPIDPNVRIPDVVKAAGSAADAIHQQFYPKDANQAPAPAKEALPQPAAPEPLHQQAPEPAPAAQEPVQAVEQQPLKPGEENISAEEWRHRFLSMQGRFNASQRSNGAMEQQMQELGQELVRTQNLLSQSQQGTAVPQAPSGQHHNNLITEEDRQSYGDELIDMARRAARDTVEPELAQLRQENKSLTDRVKSTSRRELFATLDEKLPAWRQINNDPRFKNIWLRLPNIYTGQVRGQMLKAAVDGADAPKVLALFKDFLAEAQATGQMASAAQVEQQVQPAPRQPAVNLETLAAPGRARPASGDSQVPSEKPIYSRDTIKQMYRDKQRGLYAGREAEFASFEADLGAAQREGRIR